jgi:Arm domain-containing DNA-binding protein
MLNSKARTMGLGPYPAVSLARAREKAADARTLKADGKHPVDKRRAERAAMALEAAKAMTFDQCAAASIKSHSAGWNNAKHAA